MRKPASDGERREERAREELGEEEVPAMNAARGDDAHGPPVVFVAHHRAREDDADEGGEEAFEREAVGDDVEERHRRFRFEPGEVRPAASAGSVVDAEPEQQVEDEHEGGERQQEDGRHAPVAHLEELGVEGVEQADRLRAGETRHPGSRRR